MRLAVFVNGFKPATAEREKALQECLSSACMSIDAGDVVAVLVREGEYLPDLPEEVKKVTVPLRVASEAEGRPLPYLKELLDAAATKLDCDVFLYLNSDLLMDEADARLVKSGVAQFYVLKSHEISACNLDEFRSRRFRIDVSPRPGFDALAFDRQWWLAGGRSCLPDGFILGEWRWDTAYDAIARSLPGGEGLSASGTYHRKHKSEWQARSPGGLHNDRLLRSMGKALRASELSVEEEVEVIISGSPDFMPVWCAAWEKSGNTNPVRFFADEKWGDEVRERCSEVGTVEDASLIYEDVVRRMPPGAPRFKIGWMAKPEIMRQARTPWAVWLDHDVEVQGDLRPIIEYAKQNAEWFASPVYASFCQEDLEQHVAQHGIIVYRPGHEKMKKWVDYVPTQRDPNDEHNFMRCFGGYDEARKEVLDLYRKEWYESLQTGESPIRIGEALPRLQNSTSTLVHWTSQAMKPYMLAHLGGDPRKRGAASPRPKFTATCEVKTQPERLRDAVFILGSGSRYDNLELRYAFRSLQKHCPWVRQVHVIGNNPGFLSPAVNFIREADPYGHSKDANIIHKLIRATKSPDITQEFLFCSDDQLVTQASTWEDFEPRWTRRWDPEDPWFKARLWRQRLAATLKIFGDGALAYEPHIWAPMDKEVLAEMARIHSWQDTTACIVMSLYYNFAGRPGRQAWDHSYIRSEEDLALMNRHLAYGDGAFNHSGVRAAIGRMFPEPSIYEKPS